MKNFVIYTGDYSEKIGGELVMHYLCHYLNESGYHAYHWNFNRSYVNKNNIWQSIRSFRKELKLKLKESGESLDEITISAGVAQISEEDSIESVLDRADKCLYLAKKTGRNNVKTERDLKLLANKK